MNKILENLLTQVAEWDKEGYPGAYNIRANGESAGRRSTAKIKILPKEGGSGLDIFIAEGTKGEKVFIPACITHSGVDDLVYNDFHVGEGADVTIVAGCGVHTDGDGHACHNGIHRFLLGKDSHVLYLEKHLGTGEGTGERVIDPETEFDLAEGSFLEMETSQIGGVDRTNRRTRGKIGPRAKLVIHESILTDGVQTAKTDFEVDLDGEDSSVDLISRSVAKDDSYQEYHSHIRGKAR